MYYELMRFKELTRLVVHTQSSLQVFSHSCLTYDA